jgi:hypothetical protein
MTLAAADKTKLLKRIHRSARTAAIHRLRGNMRMAQAWDRRVDALASHAEKHRLGGAATNAEERGRQAAGELHRKTGLYRKRGYDPSRSRTKSRRDPSYASRAHLPRNQKFSLSEYEKEVQGHLKDKNLSPNLRGHRPLVKEHWFKGRSPSFAANAISLKRFGRRSR